MRKHKLMLAALMCTIVFTGCKKKEPIDISSLHSTASVEKESIPATTEAASESPAQSTVSDNKNTGSPYAVKTTMKAYTDQNISIEYPEISGMKDEEKQKLVNQVIEQNAKAVSDVFVTSDSQSLTVKATVEAANLRRITITYKGDYKGSGSNIPLFYSNAIDLETAKSLGLSDYTDAYTVAGYITSGDLKLEAFSGTDENAVLADIHESSKTTDYYYKQLSTSDFSGKTDRAENEKYTAETWPKVFSYEKQGIIYVSVPVSPELGSYVIIKYSPGNK